MTLVDVIVRRMGHVIRGAAADRKLRELGTGILMKVMALGFGGLLLHFTISTYLNGGSETNFDDSTANDLTTRAIAGLIAGGLLTMIFTIIDFVKDEQINDK